MSKQSKRKPRIVEPPNEPSKEQPKETGESAPPPISLDTVPFVRCYECGQAIWRFNPEADVQENTVMMLTILAHFNMHINDKLGQIVAGMSKETAGRNAIDMV